MGERRQSAVTQSPAPGWPRSDRQGSEVGGVERKTVGSSLDRLRIFELRSSFRSSEFAQRLVVGCLPQLDACVLREGSELLLANTRRLLEMREERRLLSDCQLPSVRLPAPILVTDIK